MQTSILRQSNALSEWLGTQYEAQHEIRALTPHRTEEYIQDRHSLIRSPAAIVFRENGYPTFTVFDVGVALHGITSCVVMSK